ncbi:MAG: UDP-N-acetylmuramate dehydrogenase [Puniceicoccales bacterium]|jgi:UDP-N-acetylenolpyruvoylglucosamine reductase|nr:UDP-N-acetylmuramate dehydrogenase [Puniceicoccales bacterium]
MKKNVCMLGVSGAGMAPLAIYLAQRKYGVYGWDDYANPIIKDLLISNGIVFLPEKILPSNCDCVIRSSAVDELADEICRGARESGIKIFRRGEFLAHVCKDRKLLAIIGSHGKTSVSGNCVEILKKNGVVFDYVIGGFFKNNAFPPASYDERSEWVVAEIDESDGTIENFSPECTVALNYDDDHMSNYGSRDNFLRAFGDMFARTGSIIFVAGQDQTLTQLALKCPNKRIELLNFEAQNFPAFNQSAALFCLNKIFGKNFVLPEKIIGIQRRNDLMLEIDNFVFLNDYAHHPTEIAALLKYVKANYPGFDLNIVFQPHRLSRTRQYFAEFAEILDQFDRQVVVELYAAFEEKIEGVSSDLIFNRMKSLRKRFFSLEKFNQSMRSFCDEFAKNDRKQLVMFVGAGNILSHARNFIRDIAFSRAEERHSKEKIHCTSFANVMNFFSARVPASARIYAEPATPGELATLLGMCKSLGIRYVTIGNGTKLLPPDDTINAVVIGLKSDYWNTSKWTAADVLHCHCGVQMNEFCRMVTERRYSGVEKLVYIPGCIGGAICMNAGAHGQAISDYLLSIEVIDSDGNLHEIEKNELNFVYRGALIPRGNIILGATFRFSEMASEKYFHSTEEELLAWRKTHQPRGLNFGSVFKNGEDFYAGELIDRAGLKGKRIGNAGISPEHANFIINYGCASSRDIEKLIDTVRYEVYNKFGKFLHAEVKFLRA